MGGMTTFPSRVILTDVPLEQPVLELGGSQEVFLEYAPLSFHLSGDMRNWYSSQHLDRTCGIPEVVEKIIPLAGVRAAWVIQAGEWF